MISSTQHCHKLTCEKGYEASLLHQRSEDQDYNARPWYTYRESQPRTCFDLRRTRWSDADHIWLMLHQQPIAGLPVFRVTHKILSSKTVARSSCLLLYPSHSKQTPSLSAVNDPNPSNQSSSFI